MRTMREPDVVELLEMMLRWYSATTLETSSKQSRAVKGHDLQHRAVLTARRAVPLDVDDALAETLGQGDRVRAVVAVHRHASTLGDEAHDVVAGHGRAAPREVDHDVIEPFDVHARADVATCARGAGPS